MVRLPRAPSFASQWVRAQQLPLRRRRGRVRLWLGSLLSVLRVAARRPMYPFGYSTVGCGPSFHALARTAVSPAASAAPTWFAIGGPAARACTATSSSSRTSAGTFCGFRWLQGCTPVVPSLRPGTPWVERYSHRIFGWYLTVAIEVFGLHRLRFHQPFEAILARAPPWCAIGGPAAIACPSTSSSASSSASTFCGFRWLRLRTSWVSPGGAVIDLRLVLCGSATATCNEGGLVHFGLGCMGSPAPGPAALPLPAGPSGLPGPPSGPPSLPRALWPPGVALRPGSGPASGPPMQRRQHPWPAAAPRDTIRG